VRDRLAELSFSGVVPIFPLPEVVLFPGAGLPLHVFEPRYLAMVADACQGEGLLALTTLLPGWEDDAGGAPRFHPLATVGRIGQIERLDDGRLNLVLAGLERARLEEEYTNLPYRKARARVEPDVAVDEDDPEIVETRGRLLAVYGYLQQLMSGSTRVHLMPTEGVTFETTVHTLCQALDLPVRDKLMALEAAGPMARLPFAQQALIEGLERALPSHGLPGVLLAKGEEN
jgi:Lon protease-like protein